MRVALLAAAAALRGRVYPRLQHTDTYENDFVHDDTAHPDVAIKQNIEESHNRLHEAYTQMEALGGQVAAAKEAYVAAANASAAQEAQTQHASERVEYYRESLHSQAAIAASLDEAKAGAAAAMQRLNQSDLDATAAAEAIKEAALEFHGRNVALVEARENVALGTDNIRTWQDKVAQSLAANTSLEAWQAKLDASVEERRQLDGLAARQAAFDEAQHEHKAAAVRLAEAKKLFDVDKATYEELIGPYGEPAPAAESLWWDALNDNEWSDDIEARAPTLA